MLSLPMTSNVQKQLSTHYFCTMVIQCRRAENVEITPKDTNIPTMKQLEPPKCENHLQPLFDG